MAKIALEENISVVRFGRGKIKIAKGGINIADIGAITILSKKVHRGLLEMHDRVEINALNELLKVLSKIPERINDIHLLVEGYDVDVGLYLLTKGQRMVLMVSKKILKNRKIQEALAHFLNRINNEEIQSIRISFLTMCDPEKIVEFLEKADVKNNMDVQLADGIIDILIESPEILETFRRVRAYLSSRNVVSLNAEISSIEIFLRKENLTLWEKIFPTIIRMSSKIRQIDIDVDNVDTIMRVLDTLSELKHDIDYVFLSSSKVRIVDKNIATEILFTEEVSEKTLRETLNKAMVFIRDGKSSKITIKKEEIRVENMVKK